MALLALLKRLLDHARDDSRVEDTERPNKVPRIQVIVVSIFMQNLISHWKRGTFTVQYILRTGSHLEPSHASRIIGNQKSEIRNQKPETKAHLEKPCAWCAGSYSSWAQSSTSSYQPATFRISGWMRIDWSRMVVFVMVTRELLCFQRSRSAVNWPSYSFAMGRVPQSSLALHLSKLLTAV